MSKIRIFLTAVIAFRCRGVPALGGVFFIPGCSLLDHLDHTLFLDSDHLGGCIGGAVVDVIQALTCLPLVFAGPSACTRCNARDGRLELYLSIFFTSLSRYALL